MATGKGIERFASAFVEFLFGGDGSGALYATISRLIVLLTVAGLPFTHCFQDSNTLLPQKAVLEPQFRVFVVLFSPDSKALVSASSGSRISIWDLESAKEKAALKSHFGLLRSAALCDRGNSLIVGTGKRIAFWDLATAQEIWALEDQRGVVCSLAVAGDGDILASAAGSTISVWDLRKRIKISTLSAVGAQATCVALSENGELLLWGRGPIEKPKAVSNNNTVTLWDVKKQTEIATLIGHVGDISCAAFGPGQTLAASGSADKSVVVWDLKTYKAKHVLKGHTDTVNSIAFDKDGKWLASGSSDGTVKLWDLETGDPKFSMRGSIAIVKTVAISPNGKLLAAAGFNATNGRGPPVIVWQMPAAVKEKR